MITYGFIKRLNEDKTINAINKIIFGTFGIIIGIIMDFITLLSFPFIIVAFLITYILDHLESE